MALSAPTIRGSGTGVASATSSSFTPSNNSHIYAICTCTGDDLTTVPQTPSISDSEDLTWTLEHSHYVDQPDATGYSAQIWVYSAQITTGVSMTVSFDTSEATQEVMVQVVEYTGGNDSSRVGAKATGGKYTAGDSTPTITLGAAPASTSHVLGVCYLNDYSSTADGSVNPGTGFTEIASIIGGTSGYSHLQIQSRSGSTSTSVPWGAITWLQAYEHYALLAFEVKEGTGGDNACVAQNMATGAPVITQPTAAQVGGPPDYVGKGTFASGTAGITPGLPAGWAEGDLFILQIESANQTIATPSGWTEVPNSPQSTGTAAAAGGVRLAVFRRWATASESAPSIADSGDHTTALISAYRGVDPTSPINASAGGVDSSATTSISTPSVTTTVANCLVLHLLGLDKDLADSDTITGTWTNGNLGSITERHDQTVTSGAGGGVALVTGIKASAGSVGATTNTADSSTTHAYITLALAPITGNDCVAQNLATGAPLIAQPSASMLFALTAQDLATGAPVVGQPTLAQSFDLTAQDLVTGAPVIGQPAASMQFDLVAQDVIGSAPVIGQPTADQAQPVVAQDMSTGAPVIGQSTAAQVFDLTALDLVSGAPVIAAPSLGQLFDLTSLDLATGAPEIGTPAAGQIFDAVAQDLVTGAPEIGAPTAGQVFDLVALDLTSGAPVISQPTLAQTGVNECLADDMVSGAPMIGQPDAGQLFALTAADLVSGAPLIASPAAAQVFDLTAADLETGAPLIGQPALGQVFALVALDLVGGAPVIGAPTADQPGTNECAAADLVSGAPLIGQATLAQVFALVSLDMVSGAPVIASPSADQPDLNACVAQDCVSGAPEIGAPASWQVFGLDALDIVSGAPVIGMPTVWMDGDFVPAAARRVRIDGVARGRVRLTAVAEPRRSLGNASPVRVRITARV